MIEFTTEQIKNIKQLLLECKPIYTTTKENNLKENSSISTNIGTFMIDKIVYLPKLKYNPYNESQEKDNGYLVKLVSNIKNPIVFNPTTIKEEIKILRCTRPDDIIVKTFIPYRGRVRMITLSRIDHPAGEDTEKIITKNKAHEIIKKLKDHGWYIEAI